MACSMWHDGKAGHKEHVVLQGAQCKDSELDWEKKTNSVNDEWPHSVHAVGASGCFHGTDVPLYNVS